MTCFYKVSEQNFSISLVDLFAAVGGYLGLFLGFSVFEFISDFTAVIQKHIFTSNKIVYKINWIIRRRYLKTIVYLICIYIKVFQNYNSIIKNITFKKEVDKLVSVWSNHQDHVCTEAVKSHYYFPLTASFPLKFIQLFLSSSPHTNHSAAKNQEKTLKLNSKFL